MKLSLLKLLDKLGIGISFICILHCFLTPVLLILAVSIGFWAKLHVLFLLLVIPVTILAAWLGYRHHQNTNILWLFGIGLLLLIFAEPVSGMVNYNYSIIADISLTSLGGGFIITGHVFNHKRQRCELGCHCN